MHMKALRFPAISYTDWQNSASQPHKKQNDKRSVWFVHTQLHIDQLADDASTVRLISHATTWQYDEAQTVVHDDAFDRQPPESPRPAIIFVVIRRMKAKVRSPWLRTAFFLSKHQVTQQRTILVQENGHCTHFLGQFSTTSLLLCWPVTSSRRAVPNSESQYVESRLKVAKGLLQRRDRLTHSAPSGIIGAPVLVREGVETRPELAIYYQARIMFVRKYKGVGPNLQVACPLSLIRGCTGREGGTPRVVTGFRTGGSGLRRSWIGTCAYGWGSICQTVSAVASFFRARVPATERQVTMTQQDTNTKTLILTDGVKVERYDDQVYLKDDADNDIEETRGHVWRLDVRPDREGQLERDEDFSLYVDILDTDQPVEKAAFQRIYAAAEELKALGRKIELAYIKATGDIGPPPTAGDDLQAKYDAEWGPEIVPNVRIKHDPKSGLIDDDGNKIEGTRGHIRDLEFNDKALDERGGIFTLADYFDDRDAPTVNEAAAKRLLAAAGQLRDTAIELAPRMAEQLSRLMVEITGPDQPRYVVAFKDPRVGFCEQHNQRSSDGTTARIIERPTLADVPDTDFNQVHEKAVESENTNSTAPDGPNQ